jgi:hypothetical protein
MKPVRNPLDIPLLHPFLIALFPVLSLWLSNADQSPLFTVFRPILYMEAVALLAILIGLAIFHKAGKASIFASLFVILFFTYGHVMNLVDMKSILGIVVGRHRVLIPLWLILLVTGAWVIGRSRSSIAIPNRIFNVVSLFLMCMLFIQIGIKQLNARPVSVSGATADQPAAENRPVDGKTYPDIYYIILDGYAREDVLAQQHGINIHPFIQQLRSIGFTVLDCGQSNYTMTPFSIAATLNMNYLDTLGVPLNPAAAQLNYEDYTELITHSQVRNKLKALGYRFESFKPLYPWMDIKDSDDYYDVEKSSNLYDRQESVEFQYLFLKTTFMRITIEMEGSNPDPFNRMPPWLVQIFNPKARLLSTRNYKQRDQNLYELQVLRNAAQLPGPKFFYLHFFITHPPYMFRPDGSQRWPVTQNQEGYDEQILYVNSQMVKILKGVIQDSKIPPIIILQADHGYHASFEPIRVKILDAYYLPDGGEELLYPTFTPVNTFRLIFNKYFGENNRLIEDKSLFSPKDKPYQFQSVPNNCPSSLQ